MGSFRAKAFSGFGWSFLIQGGTQIVNFVVTVLLARLLMPSEFGLIGMIAIFLAISRALVDGGFVSSLIRTKDADNDDYSTVFFVNLVSSIFLYAILFFVAPYIAQYYEQNVLVRLIRVLSLVLVINAFSLVQSTKLNKALQFKTQFMLQFPSLVISAVFSVWMAYNGYGVWSLVTKELCYALLATIQLWWYSSWRPSFVFNKGKFRYHFNFGYKLSLTQIINSSFDNLYNVIIGKYFSAAQLGYFTRARSLEQLPSNFFYNAFNRVAYPLLAQVENEKHLKIVYSQLMRTVVFIVTPILVYLGIIAEPFFRWLLTEKWLPAVPYFQLLLIAGVFFPIHRYNLNICNLKGRSDLVLELSLLQNVLLLLGGLTAFWLGIYGLLYSLIFVNLLVTAVNTYFSGKLIRYSSLEQMKDLVPLFLLNVTVGGILYILQILYLSNMRDFYNIICSGVLTMLLYFGFAFIANLNILRDLKRLRSIKI